MERSSDWLDGGQLNKMPPAYLGPIGCKAHSAENALRLDCDEHRLGCRGV